MADHIEFLVLVLLCITNSFGFVSGQVKCIATEREALLKLKQGLIDDNGILSSWGSEADKMECCNWNGVTCRNTTGHVIGLQLNKLGGQIGTYFLDLTQLASLDLSSNSFQWSIIPNYFGNLTNLKTLDLSGNQLNGSIPDSFGQLIFLKFLSLSDNMLEGGIPKSFGNLSRLQYLLLDGNNLGRPLVELFGNLCCKAMLSLRYLDFSDDQLTGFVPDLSSHVSLRSLSLSGNRLTGSLPLSLGNLTNLVELDVSVNSLDGIISQAHFLKLQNLKSLDLSFNPFEMQISREWNPPFRLETLILSFCKLGPHFPTWLQDQKNLEILDLSHTSLSDEVPRWLWGLFPTTNTYLNLSYNEIHGTIPNISLISTRFLDITSNNFSGPMLMFHSNASIVQISNNKFNGSISSICLNELYPYLVFFDASNNEFEGVLPDCWERMDRLKILNLDNNYFSGRIPPSLGFLWELETLVLSDNYLSGELPSTLSNCTILMLLNVKGNNLSGNIPTWMGTNFTFMKYLILRDNEFSGSIPDELCNVTNIHLLDLSRNNISGKIPRCFDQFTSLLDTNGESYSLAYIPLYGTFNVEALRHFLPSYMNYAIVQWKGREAEYQKNLGFLTLIDLSNNRLVGCIPRELSSLQGLTSLNLSRNYLTGNIDPNISQMKMLESLDLSRNQLGSVIPAGLSQLHFLQVLDLSNNNLSGKIPSGTQLQSFNASAYAGNVQLCGPPLAPCLEDPSPKEGESSGRRKGFSNLSFGQALGISMGFGFIFGFWGIVGPLLLKKSWRITYYKFFDRIGDWFYVKIALIGRRA